MSASSAFDGRRGGTFQAWALIIIVGSLLLPAGAWGNPWLNHLWTPAPILDTAVSSISGGMGFSLDRFNNPAVTYQGRTDPGPGGLNYASLSGSSFASQVVDATWNAGQASALTFSGTTPHISYRGYDDSAFNVSYAAHQSGSWLTALVYDTSPTDARHSDIIIDTNGTVAIAWLDRRVPGNFEDDTLDFAYWDGSTWAHEHIADDPLSAATVSLGTTGDATDAQVAWAHDAWPNVLPKHSRRTGDDTWVTDSVQTTGSVAYLDMAFDADGNPVVAYLDATNRNIMYAYKSGGTWHTELVYDGAWNPAFADRRLLGITVDHWGVPHLLFFDAAANDLLYTNRAYGTWQDVRVIAEDTPANWLHITTDTAGRPHFAYMQDDTTGDGRMYYGAGSAVPEPGTWALIIVGCAAIALLRRRRAGGEPAEQ